MPGKQIPPWHTPTQDEVDARWEQQQRDIAANVKAIMLGAIFVLAMLTEIYNAVYIDSRFVWWVCKVIALGVGFFLVQCLVIKIWDMYAARDNGEKRSR
jgi:hypothetical protein